MSVTIAFLSLVLESQIGYPDRVFRAIGHPVTWIGRLISCLDRMLNRATDSDRRRRLYGVLALIAIIAIPGGLAFGLERLLITHTVGFIALVILGSTLFSQLSLADHVEAVADALDSGGLAAGREAVSKIVGRDPEQLDEAGVARAAIESLAENFSDGIVAPAFWFCVGGLGGGVAYKAVNTANSMIGHRTPRHEAFRLGVGALRRSGQPARLPVDCAAAGRSRGASPEGRCTGCVARRLARCEKAPLAECRLAGSGDGRCAWPRAGGTAQLWRRDGRLRLHGRRPARCHSNRYPARAAAVLDS